MSSLLSSADATPIWLSLKLAGLTTVILLLLATPLAWWLCFTRTRVKPLIVATITLPLVLPPTVLGFYLLVLLGPRGWVGQVMNASGLDTLPFTFTGLLVASVIYSLPFAVQPLHNTFQGIGRRPLEAAATLGANAWDRFFTIALPLGRPGFLTAAVLSFAHTLGEFGVVLMIGGNIPGETRVLSVAIYEHVESLEYNQAHLLAAGLLVFSFSVLLLLQTAATKPEDGR